MIDNHLIEQIRAANDIVEVIQGYLPLKRAGSTWRGICPFHQDTNPSLNVSQTKQIFKCFACGKAGNVYGFVQEYEKISFIEAVKKLAQRAGIAIPRFERTKRVNTKREQLLVVYQTARDFFAENLQRHGDEALEYLNSRQISPETAQNLQLGYALGGEKALLNHLMKEGHAVALLKESGLFGVYRGNVVDLFRDRLMFPIHNNTGDVIAFGGRQMAEGSPGGKYINSPSGELYTKGNELYGLFKSKYELSKADSVLVCEGYFDFLRLWDAGFVNSVATLGTALTKDQIYLLARYTKNVYMLFDGDVAGIRSATRGAALCMALGLSPFIVELPPDSDPDTFLLEEGKEAMQQRIDSALPLINFVATHPQVEGDAKERIDLLLEHIRQNQDAVQRELWIKDMADAFGVSTSALNSRLSSGRQAFTRQEPQSAPAEKPAAEEFLEERTLLILSLQSAEYYKVLATELNEDYFNNMQCREIYQWLVKHIDPDVVGSPADILNNIENTHLRDALAELLLEDPQQLRFEDTLDQVKIRKLQRDLEMLDKQILSEPHDVGLLQKKQELMGVYRRMTRKVIHKLPY